MEYAELEVQVGADECYRRLCDVEAVPSWVPSVSEVRVEERDDDGRVTGARFIGGHGSAGIAYSLVYRYDVGRRSIAWSIRETGLRELEGEAVVTPLGRDRCRLRYGLRSSSLVFRGLAVHVEGEAPETAAESFRRWVESTSS